MNILITGGAGYLGSLMANSLLRQNHCVSVIDDLSTGFRVSLNSEVQFYQGKIQNEELVTKILIENKIEAVFHFAAKLNLSESINQPLEYYESNVFGMMALLKSCQKAHIKNFVFSSSAAVYGDTLDKLISEDSIKNPKNPYAYSKLFAEKILQDMATLTQMKFLILRYFNPAGAADDLKNGQRTQNPFQLIHLASQAAVGLREHIEIYGQDYLTPDQTCVRDYIHVEDLVEVHRLCFNQLLKDRVSRIFNCGYGQGFSVRQVVDTMLKIAPVKFKIIFSARRLGDPARLVADTKYLHSVLDWKPQRNQIENICRSALEWELKLKKPVR